MTKKIEQEATNMTKAERRNLPFVEKKRPFAETNDIVSKKPKLNDQIKRENSNPFEIFSNHNHVNGRSQTKLPETVVPIPTSRLEDLLSDESLPSSNSSISSTNYQSFSQIFENSKNDNSQIDEDEALRKILMVKQTKRILYTGRKATSNAGFKIPKLSDLASKVLSENIDELPMKMASLNSQIDKPIEFSCVVKVLERANAKQLQNIEYYCPYLLENTDLLWKKLCEIEFKHSSGCPDEDETWRELYYRKIDEREEKFRRARELISRKQAEKPKERQIKEANVKFVSSTAKNSSMVHTASSAASKLKVINSSSGPVRQIVHDSSNRKIPIQASTSQKKPASAPVMSQGMKATMKLMKRRR